MLILQNKDTMIGKKRQPTADPIKYIHSDTPKKTYLLSIFGMELNKKPIMIQTEKN